MTKCVHSVHPSEVDTRGACNERATLSWRTVNLSSPASRVPAHTSGVHSRVPPRLDRLVLTRDPDFCTISVGRSRGSAHGPHAGHGEDRQGERHSTFCWCVALAGGVGFSDQNRKVGRPGAPQKNCRFRSLDGFAAREPASTHLTSHNETCVVCDRTGTARLRAGDDYAQKRFTPLSPRVSVAVPTYMLSVICSYICISDHDRRRHTCASTP